ncbi:MAG: hypothetical protein J6B77_04540 [Clostridia bacterium]|nr:hypothetical protein [Clostridia bacterium]
MAKKQKIGYQQLDNAYTRDIDGWFIFVMLAFFFPVGLWLMWTRTRWKTWVKIVVTVIVILLFVSNIITGIVQGNSAGAGDETTVAAVRRLMTL